MSGGKCEECLASPCPPAPVNATDEHFVCDEDGNTRTVCEFQMLSCIVERSLGTNISVQHLENCRGAKLEMPQVTTAHLGSCDGVKGVVRGVSSEESSSSDESDEDDKKRSEGISNCPTTCNNIYSPVCGTDDVTYTNLCQMRLKQCRKGTTIGLAYKGECCTMDCPNNFSPVCDDRGITHQNLCTFGKERCIVEKVTGRNITISKFDVCDENSCQKECDMTYKPICASNGETLINECYLEKLNCILAKRLSGDLPVKKLYNGECCPNENCGYDFSPVCDSLGETHANECVFRRTACLKQRKANVSINIQYKGLCCNRQCSDEYLPVCDGNRTYQNICEFKIAQCEAERHGQVFMLAYPGECCSLPKGKCEATGECCTIEVCHKGDSSPVCDTRGGTHATKCHFQNTKCIHDKIHPNNPINLAYNGVCFVCDWTVFEPREPIDRLERNYLLVFTINHERRDRIAEWFQM
ncbi:unnamed protein product [Nippostrongylus brasiliensis]|uniref:Agrin n=1 Tax=Nippostrongylus brasiliensis TaxID=27835 RepID=A0A158QYY3_NIPBR|nr:unnamed protein product [Nippostrongylus brasiliensis]